MTGDAKPRAFLNVERSASARRWKARLDDQRTAEAISQRHELPEIIGRVLAARGVDPDLLGCPEAGMLSLGRSTYVASVRAYR